MGNPLRVGWWSETGWDATIAAVVVLGRGAVPRRDEAPRPPCVMLRRRDPPSGVAGLSAGTLLKREREYLDFYSQEVLHIFISTVPVYGTRYLHIMQAIAATQLRVSTK